MSDRITQKYLHRWPDSKRSKSWAGRLVHIQTENGVWRTNGKGYTYAGKDDAWVLPFEDAQKQVAHCGPEKQATFILATRPAAPVEGLETVAWLKLVEHTDLEGENFTSADESYRGADRSFPVVTRSQAEAIIVAERAENTNLKAGIKRLSDEEELLAETTDGDMISVVKLAARLAEAEADNAALTAKANGVEDYIKGLIDDRNVAQEDNAALTARVKELETERTMIVSHATMGGTNGIGLNVNEISVCVTALRNELYNEGKKRAEALETQLATAKSALEEIDRKAQAGLCAGSFQGARAFHEDIRIKCAALEANHGE